MPVSSSTEVPDAKCCCKHCQGTVEQNMILGVGNTYIYIFMYAMCIMYLIYYWHNGIKYGKRYIIITGLGANVGIWYISRSCLVCSVVLNLSECISSTNQPSVARAVTRRSS